MGGVSWKKISSCKDLEGQAAPAPNNALHAGRHSLYLRCHLSHTDDFSRYFDAHTFNRSGSFKPEIFLLTASLQHQQLSFNRCYRLLVITYRDGGCKVEEYGQHVDQRKDRKQASGGLREVVL